MKKEKLIKLLVTCYLLFAGCSGNGWIAGNILGDKDILPEAYVMLKGSETNTLSDSLGNYLLKNIPEGEYELLAGYSVIPGKINYHRCTVEKVKVKKGHVSIVPFHLTPDALPESRWSDYAWEETDSNCIPIERFLEKK